ncbi:PP2C family protein-serine/threonine phosphatase [Butyrivibrio sp. AE3004]|uniref:PP2C family protein-serine/threonine phosphatase n=1 Tax=Butyrivibrio sp. AE3004 TaxID=1506994 RepID=UPI00068921E3|nr:PP2C family protein-serine/threonine phosphatase [Butyrivibrio sp. AE3004]
MKKQKSILRGGIRQKIFSMMLITIILIITAYTIVFFYQTSRVEKLVNDTYEMQRQAYKEIGLQAQYQAIQSYAMESFKTQMFHARNVLLILIVIIVVAGLISAYSISGRIIDPLNTITRRVASLGIRHSKFKMEDVYRTGDEIEVLAEAFAKQSERTLLYIDKIKRVTAEKERIGAELEMASKIQASQLPRLFPPFPDRKEFSLYASMDPAKEVGGDFYDFFMIDDDHLGLVMADVSGKGVPAALLMMVTRVLIKSRLQSGSSPEETLESVNNQLCESNDEDFFVTMWVGVIQISTGKGIAVNAGHEHPALRRADGQYELIIYKHAMPVGTMEGLKFRQHEFEMNPGDSLFVYTDGVPEANNSQDELYGTERMLNALNTNPDAQPEEALSNISKDINRFVAGAEQFDDITMLLFTYHGENGKNNRNLEA